MEGVGVVGFRVKILKGDFVSGGGGGTNIGGGVSKSILIEGDGGANWGNSGEGEEN